MGGSEIRELDGEILREWLKQWLRMLPGSVNWNTMHQNL